MKSQQIEVGKIYIRAGKDARRVLSIDTINSIVTYASFTGVEIKNDIKLTSENNQMPLVSFAAWAKKAVSEEQVKHWFCHRLIKNTGISKADVEALRLLLSEYGQPVTIGGDHRIKNVYDYLPAKQVAVLIRRGFLTRDTLTDVRFTDLSSIVMQVNYGTEK
jgi:hypothetical protein